ncbi:unnamed protein product [Peronospora belbahrii]|uniref:Uncharacterized protein n=1 Tax=Peronospora belbahrii TaxID=622444 RepID=A0ABN8CSK2_9STRA|nr:unnamed protein product [Peronospora belbahrii]
MHITIPPRAAECFSIEVENYKHGISLNYEVLRGAADELETVLRDGKQQIVYTRKGASGRYVTPIGEDDPSHEVLSNADTTKIKQVQELEDMVYELSVSLDTVKDTQAYMKAITNYHNKLITNFVLEAHTRGATYPLRK